ncbi:helix-turn-helix domain-containing protein [Nannocystaceae bacterium ST9]
MDFGRTLRLLRIDAGLSLRGLARTIGVSGAYLSRVENGHDPPPTADRLIAIARAIRLPPERLLELAHPSDVAVAGYLQRVPAVAHLFMQIAERNLDGAQVARVMRFVDEQFPEQRALGDTPLRLRPLLQVERLALRIRCDDRADLIAVVAAKLAAGEGGSSATLIRALHEREREASTELGEGLLLPHAALPGVACRAALVTLAQPLASAPGRPDASVAIGLIYDSEAEPPLPLLAHLAHFAEPERVEQLRACTSPAQLLRTVAELEAPW